MPLAPAIFPKLFNVSSILSVPALFNVPLFVKLPEITFTKESSLLFKTASLPISKEESVIISPKFSKVPPVSFNISCEILSLFAPPFVIVRDELEFNCKFFSMSKALSISLTTKLALLLIKPLLVSLSLISIIVGLESSVICQIPLSLTVTDSSYVIDVD